ncbi:MAG TPA: ATPase domain-containing protein [Thermoanaerobaculia bacterium]|nr:ATPase domain-containing protein [Thermoanaerobaculia bacterium]
MKRLTSGDPDLDRVLGGGFPRNANVIVMGGPGSGKTVLAEQMVFANAGDRPALYLTTLSEPLAKIVNYLQEFAFADLGRIGNEIVYESLAEVLSEDADALLAHLTGLIQQYRPGVIVIDSFKAVGELFPDARAWRVLVFELARLLSAYDTLGLWIGEYSPESVTALPEFAVADGIVSLQRHQRGTRDERLLKVIKLRGSDFLGGEHVFEITANGLRTFPRLVAPAAPSAYDPVAERVQTGIGGLDSMIESGWLRGTTSLIAGPSGAGKTMVGLHFLRQGVIDGEPGLLVNFQESPIQLERSIRSLGWDPESLLGPDRLDLLYRAPVELQIDTIVREMYRRFENNGVRRLVIDALGDLEKSALDPRRFTEYLYVLTQEVARRGITTLLILKASPAHDATGSDRLGRDASNMSDNVVLLTMDLGQELIRSIRIVKTRGSSHVGRRQALRLSTEGVFVGERL